jgi:hypothetical protein
MSLTAKEIAQAKPSDKIIRRSDGGGLYLEIVPAGGKWWRLKYRFHGKENRLSFGVYPEVGLQEARRQRYVAKQLLAQGINPAVVRREQKAREIAEKRVTQNASKVQISVSTSGTVEIWKGRAVLPLTLDEARAVSALLTKLTV